VDCEEAKAVIERSAAEELPPAETVALQSHVTDCAACRTEMEALGRSAPAPAVRVPVLGPKEGMSDETSSLVRRTPLTRSLWMVSRKPSRREEAAAESAPEEERSGGGRGSLLPVVLVVLLVLLVVAALVLWHLKLPPFG